MYILGINAYHGDAAACLVRNGTLVCAVEEERIRRIKHWAGLPVQAISRCLEIAGITLDRVDYVSINRMPGAHGFRKIGYGLLSVRATRFLFARYRNKQAIVRLREEICRALDVPLNETKFQLNYVEHHDAHIGSSYLVSPFSDAAALSIDGFGDFVSTALGIGFESEFRILERVYFPHSLGIFYQALTQYLGFPNYGDEYKVMGLASYGKPTFYSDIKRLVELVPNGKFRLNLNYFNHARSGVEMSWRDGSPVVGKLWSDELESLIGPSRNQASPIGKREMDIAASVQLVYEEALFHILEHLHRIARLDRLVLSGGCAMNSVANGKIIENTPFRELYAPPAPGDAGGAVGAALTTWTRLLRQPRVFVQSHAYWGPSSSEKEMEATILESMKLPVARGCSLRRAESEEALCEEVSDLLARGAVIGWFQGRMEWGPRALGNRSIIADPRRADMKDVINSKIKRRESFRPFAPSVLVEQTVEWFATSREIPFMLEVYPVRAEKRHLIPAVTHIDGSGRLQTVSYSDNPRYYNLIRHFFKKTGVPIILNTSFNENEPIVCEPTQALDCFFRTRMDVLVLENFIISRDALE